MRIRLDEHDEHITAGPGGIRGDLLTIEVTHDDHQHVVLRIDASPDDEPTARRYRRTLTVDEARALGVMLITAADVAPET